MLGPIDSIDCRLENNRYASSDYKFRWSFLSLYFQFQSNAA